MEMRSPSWIGHSMFATTRPLLLYIRSLMVASKTTHRPSIVLMRKSKNSEFVVSPSLSPAVMTVSETVRRIRDNDAQASFNRSIQLLFGTTRISAALIQVSRPRLLMLWLSVRHKAPNPVGRKLPVLLKPTESSPAAEDSLASLINPRIRGKLSRDFSRTRTRMICLRWISSENKAGPILTSVCSASTTSSLMTINLLVSLPHFAISLSAEFVCSGERHFRVGAGVCQHALPHQRRASGEGKAFGWLREPASISAQQGSRCVP